jgi:hypothetical protein
MRDGIQTFEPWSPSHPDGPGARADHVVCSPQAGRGRGRRLLPALLEALRGHGLEVEHAQTRAAGEEATLAAEAIARGHRTVAIVGGDGTWSNAAAAVIASGQPVRVGLVPAGTGADLARSFSIPRDMEGCARVLAGGHTRAMDAGLVDGRPQRGRLRLRRGGHRGHAPRAALRGPLLYLFCALRQLGSYRGFEGRSRWTAARCRGARR